MSNTFINVLDALARETLSNRMTLVEVFVLDQASQLGRFVNLFDLTEGKFDSVVLRRVRHDPYPLDCKFTHQLYRLFCLVSSQIVHNDSDLLTLIELTELTDEATEYFRVHSAIMLLKILEAASFTDCRNDCCVPNIHPLYWQPDVFIALTPLLR